MKRLLIYSFILLTLSLTVQSCGGKKRVGGGKQKKGCNCGF